MTTDQGHVLLAGSVVRENDTWTVEDVFRNCASYLGEHVPALPDGEVGDRNRWINYVARHTYSQHPNMRTISRHTFDDWKPLSYPDHWRFTIDDDVNELHFDRIGYADEAKKSYEIFTKLRREGAIPDGVRFQVCLPLIESATRTFIDTARNFEILWRAYGEAISREVQDIVATIPHEDLLIQWDVCLEVAAVEGVEVNWAVEDGGLDQLPTDSLERYGQAVRWMCQSIPEDVWLGLHICYGSLGHEEGKSSDTGHFKEIEDLNVSVDMANKGVAEAGRSVQYVHLPVQYSNGFKESFYEPLSRLNVGDTHIYLGLVHLQDGVEGTQRRMEIARKYLTRFGIATQCGWGRLPSDQRVEDVLEVERSVADRAWQQTTAEKSS